MESATVMVVPFARGGKSRVRTWAADHDFKPAARVTPVIQYARTMTWKGKHPVVELVTTTYQTGVKLTKAAMKIVESQLERLPHLDKWFVDIECPSPASRDSL
jgi:Rhodopirellula transposase DDE domain